MFSPCQALSGAATSWHTDHPLQAASPPPPPPPQPRHRAGPNYHSQHSSHITTAAAEHTKHCLLTEAHAATATPTQYQYRRLVHTHTHTHARVPIQYIHVSCRTSLTHSHSYTHIAGRPATFPVHAGPELSAIRHRHSPHTPPGVHPSRPTRLCHTQ